MLKRGDRVKLIKAIDASDVKLDAGSIGHVGTVGVLADEDVVFVDFANATSVRFDPRQVPEYLKVVPVNALTKIEVEILELRARGSTHREISAARRVALGTTKAQVAALFIKLGAKNGAHAVTIAHRCAIIDLDELEGLPR